MIIRYTKNLAITALIIAIIIISSIGSMGIRSNIINDNDVFIKSSISSIKTSAQIITTKSYGSLSMDDDFNNTDNIVITNTTGDESYPSIVVSGYNALVAYEYESENNTHVYLRNSVNYGASWSSGFVSFGSQFNSFSPSLCIRPFSKTAYCTAISDNNNSAVIYDVEIPNIDKINELEAYLLDWSIYGFYNFSKPDIAYYSKQSSPNVSFITGFTGSTTYTGGVANESLMFIWRDSEGASYWIQWDPSLEYCSNVSLKTNLELDTIYGVCEINNGSNQDILFFSGYHRIYTQGGYQLEEIVLTYQNFIGPEDLTHPQIFLTEDQIYIVTEKDSNEIILINSPDNGNNWFSRSVTSNILPPGSIPKYPFLIANETQLSCVFMESGNISITKSFDDGTNWDIPTQLNNQNGSVVEEYRFSDFPDADHVVWTDNREGNNDIYLALEALPEIDIMVVPDSIKIMVGEYKRLPTKNWITFTVKNNGNAYIEDVIVVINYTCQNITKSTKYPGYILYLNGNGAEKTFYKPLFRFTLNEFLQALRNFAGIQNITITVDPYKIYKDSNPDDNSVTIEVDYAEIFPNLYFLEKIFAR